MKLLAVILLACILGAVLGNIINSAVRDIAKGEKTSCRGKVML